MWDDIYGSQNKNGRRKSISCSQSQTQTRYNLSQRRRKAKRKLIMSSQVDRFIPRRSIKSPQLPFQMSQTFSQTASQNITTPIRIYDNRLKNVILSRSASKVKVTEQTTLKKKKHLQDFCKNFLYVFFSISLPFGCVLFERDGIS